MGRTPVPRTGAHVILESEDGITLQLRDDVHLWGIFGGLVRAGEDPERAALREIEEELTIRLDPERLAYLRVFAGKAYTSHLFHYAIEDELQGAVLTEGERFATWERGDLDQADVVPWHWRMLRWYWENVGGKEPS